MTNVTYPPGITITHTCKKCGSYMRVWDVGGGMVTISGRTFFARQVSYHCDCGYKERLRKPLELHCKRCGEIFGIAMRTWIVDWENLPNHVRKMVLRQNS